MALIVMNFYELTFVMRADLNPSEVEALTKEMADIATAQGAKLIKQESWGLRKLAYLINKSNRGHYVFFGLEATPEALRELERNLSNNENVIRQLTIRVDAISDKPSAPIRADDEREYDVAS
jgi:small subunit ribosomal protein S6